MNDDIEKGERVKRTVTEVLGADGLPIKIGDTVYSKSGTKYVVSEVYRRESKGLVEFVGEPKRGWVAAYLTHTPPDTQEQIDADALMDAGKYVAGHPEAAGLREPPGSLSAKQAMMADLLRRQRELDAREMGGAK